MMFQASCNDRKKEKWFNHERDFEQREDKSLSNSFENWNL